MPKSPLNQYPASSIRSWVEWASQAFDEAGLFYGHGTDNAIDEAAFLISHALNTDFDFSGFDIDQPLSTAQNESIHALLNDRITSRKPAAYLVGEAWFAGYPFYVDEHVLVPRSPLAELITDKFEPWIDSRQVRSVIDIGTGSGCIALACALYLPQARVDAVDIDEHALAVTQRNIQRYQLEDRVRAVQSDLLTQVPSHHYDVIISNPPYVAISEYDSLPAEFLQEPQLGLTAGDDGLDCVRDILAKADEYLTEQGILVVEVGNSQAALEQAYPRVAFTWLEFEHGGEGVFLLDKKQIQEHREYFQEQVRQ